MSAADKREELEAAVRDLMKGVEKCAHPVADHCRSCEPNALAVLVAADSYAMAVADRRVNRMDVGELKARLRLAEATAETAGAP